MIAKVAISLLLMVSCASAADHTSHTPTITQHQLDRLASHWQHILQLDDWQVTVQSVPLSEMMSGAYGMSDAISEVQVLHIYVLRPEDYPKLAAREGLRPKVGKQITRDIEDTVLHELLHLRLRQYRIADEQGMGAAEEMVVVRLTNALLGKR